MQLFKVGFKVHVFQKFNSSFCHHCHSIFVLFLFHFQFVFILFHFCPFAFNLFSSCLQPNRFHWKWSTLCFLSIPLHPSNSLQTLSHWWYLIHPNWDPESVTVRVINSTQCHELPTNPTPVFWLTADPELLMVPDSPYGSIIGHSEYHQLHLAPPIPFWSRIYIMGTILETPDWCTYIFVLAMYIFML